MKAPEYIAAGMLVSGIFLNGCGSDDSTGGGTSGAAGASAAGAGGSSSGAAGVGSAGASGSNATIDAGGGQAGGSGSSSSPECNAYCAKVESECMGMATCDRASICRIRGGGCAASTNAYLRCVVDSGQWSCVGSDFFVTTSCKLDNTVCM
jgi:hypothetical protein